MNIAMSAGFLALNVLFLLAYLFNFALNLFRDFKVQKNAQDQSPNNSRGGERSAFSKTENPCFGGVYQPSKSDSFQQHF